MTLISANLAAVRRAFLSYSVKKEGTLRTKSECIIPKVFIYYLSFCKNTAVIYSGNNSSSLLLI